MSLTLNITRQDGRSSFGASVDTRFGTLGKVGQSFLLRSDNGLVFTSRSYTALVKSYGLQQERRPPGIE